MEILIYHIPEPEIVFEASMINAVVDSRYRRWRRNRGLNAQPSWVKAGEAAE